MNATTPLGALLALAFAIAGCAGDFDVRQTEPIRIQVDGEGGESRISADDRGDGSADGEAAPKEQRFVIEPEEDDETVTVNVVVTKVEAAGAPMPNETGNETGDDEGAVVRVIVEDDTTKERLAEETVEADEAPGETTIDVDVKGRNNVVVIAEAEQGTADVNVDATSQSRTNETVAPTPG